MLKAQSKNKRCAIHGRYDCCGREPAKPLEQKKGWRKTSPGVWRIDDPCHPRGYRERRSPAAMRDLVDRKIVEQDGLCSLCGIAFDDRRDVTPDHTDPRGNGGAFRDDHPDKHHRRTFLVQPGERLPEDRMTLRTTHAALIPEWEFVEGEPMTAVCGATVKKAVAIDSEDGQIPSVSCGDCAPKVRQALAEKRYVVVFCRGDEIGKKQQGS